MLSAEFAHFYFSAPLLAPFFFARKVNFARTPVTKRYALLNGVQYMPRTAFCTLRGNKTCETAIFHAKQIILLTVN